MLKTVAAIGLSAAIALLPLAAFAQTDQGVTPGTPATPTAPATQTNPDAGMKPMKHHTAKHHMKHHTAKKSMAPAAPAAPADAPKS